MSHLGERHHQRLALDAHGDFDGRRALVIDQRRDENGVQGEMMGLKRD